MFSFFRSDFSLSLSSCPNTPVFASPPAPAPASPDRPVPPIFFWRDPLFVIHVVNPHRISIPVRAYCHQKHGSPGSSSSAGPPDVADLDGVVLRAPPRDTLNGIVPGLVILPNLTPHFGYCFRSFPRPRKAWCGDFGDPLAHLHRAIFPVV